MTKNKLQAMDAISGVHLVTGLIGSGKTLRMVHLIKKELARGRYVAACNINGLRVPGVVPFDDPRKWQDLPAGALLVVDEAQRFWRTRRTAEVPLELQAMETSRHDAVSFLIATQQPTYLDKHLRGLITTHEHLYRRNGLPFAEVFRWNRCVDEPMGSEREGAEKSIFSHSKEDFADYESAEVHTVKPRLGTTGKLVIAALVVVVALGAWVYNSIKAPAGAPAARPTKAGLPPQAASRQGVDPLTPEQYLAKLQPRIASMPASAPIYDGGRPVARPVIACMSTGAGLDANGRRRPASCTCLTQQGSAYDPGQELCRMMAAKGTPFDPFRGEPRQSVSAMRSGAGPQRPASAVGASMGAPAPAPSSGAGQWGSAPPPAATMAVGQ